MKNPNIKKNEENGFILNFIFAIQDSSEPRQATIQHERSDPLDT